MKSSALINVVLRSRDKDGRYEDLLPVTVTRVDVIQLLRDAPARRRRGRAPDVERNRHIAYEVERLHFQCGMTYADAEIAVARAFNLADATSIQTARSTPVRKDGQTAAQEAIENVEAYIAILQNLRKIPRD